MFANHRRFVIWRVALVCVVTTQMFAALPVRAASNSGNKTSSSAGGIARTIGKELGNRPSFFIATPTPILYTLVLQPDAAAGVDTFIYSGSKNTNYGAAVEMGIGEDNNSNNKTARSLLKFDLSSIPANATITTATLSLWTSKDLSSNTRIIGVYRLKTPFQETQATWNGPAAGVSWQTAGAAGTNDRESTAIGSVSIPGNEALNQEKQIVLQPARIQEMVSGVFVNRGFLLAADTEQNDRFNYITSDSTASTRRPRLVVQYTVPPVIASETPTDTPFPTASYTSSPTATPTFSPTVIPTFTSSATPEPSDTPPATATRTFTPSATNTPSNTPSATETRTFTPSATTMPSNTPSATATRTFTPSATITPSSTPSATATRTFTPSATQPGITPPTSTDTATTTFTPEPIGTTPPTNTPTAVWVETDTPTPVVSAMGPLAASFANPRYFAKPDGTIVYLTGSHTWCGFMDCGATDPITTTFDYNAYLAFLADHNHNFFRLWRAENARGGEAGPDFWFNPMPYQRSTTCCAFDGGDKFDLAQFDQAYFDRMRQRVIEAGDRGIYVSIMLFDGWSVDSKFGGHNPWDGHPYNINNNIDGVDGDLNDDNQGDETHTLASSQVTALQEAYVRKVIDTVNDLDNVLYEISNESAGSTANTDWQYHMINYIKSYEASRAKQHPVGMTATWPNYSGTALINSPADWISLGSNVNIDTFVPPVASGNKVIIADTDHLCGICGNRQWVWKSFTRGENPIFMDVYDPATTSRGMPMAPTGNEVDIRNNLGYARSYASRINLVDMIPQPDLCSTGYCLVKTGVEYLAYLPSGNSITIDLRASIGSFSVEWFNPLNGITVNGGFVDGGSSRTLNSPFAPDAVLYLKSISGPTITPQATSSPTASPSPSPTCTVASATSTATPTRTPYNTGTSTFTPLPTETMTRTPTFTVTPASSPTFTQTLTPSSTPRPTGTSTPTPTRTPTSTGTSTPTSTATVSVGFPITSVRDNFDRANGSIGVNWAGYASAFRITSNQLDVNTTGWNTYILWQGSSFGADQEAYMTLAQVDPSTNEHSLILKSQSGSDSSAGLIYIQYDGFNRNIQIWTYHPAQGWVQYGSAIPVTFAAGDQFGARARPDGTVEVYRNGTLLGTRSITSWPYYASGGYIGLWMVNAPNALLDNFGGGTR